MRSTRIPLLFTALSMILLLAIGCSHDPTSMPQSQLKNEAARAHAFLADMYADEYFPKHLVDQGRDILVDLCHTLEARPPKDLDELYVHTHQATERFNDLQSAFEAAGSEMETAARENIGMDFAFIAQAYGFDADVEELIAPREW
jgi:hypothetical protein